MNGEKTVSNYNFANFLSVSRLAFLPLLVVFVLFDMTVAFIVGYILVGATDYFDGIVARRFDMKTELGKKLDSLADLFFYLASAWFLYVLYKAYLEPNLIIMYIFFGLLALSFVVSGILCKKPIMMHTLILKFNAVMVYFLVIFSAFFDTTYIIAAVIILYIIGFIEEIMIFFVFGDVDPDSKSFYHLMREKKQEKEA